MDRSLERGGEEKGERERQGKRRRGGREREEERKLCLTNTDGGNVGVLKLAFFRRSNESYKSPMSAMIIILHSAKCPKLQSKGQQSTHLSAFWEQFMTTQHFGLGSIGHQKSHFNASVKFGSMI